MEDILKQSNGVGNTFIDMSSSFEVLGLWVMPRATGERFAATTTASSIYKRESLDSTYLAVDPKQGDNQATLLKQIMEKYWLKTKLKGEFKWMINY